MWSKARATKNSEETEDGRYSCHGPAAKARALKLSNAIIAAAIEVHRNLGPGLLESAYQACLSRELRSRGIRLQEQVLLPINYKGFPLDLDYRLDLLVEDLIIVELKSVERLEPVHHLQILTYLRLSNRWLGLLINFNTDLIKHGLRRHLNG